MRKAIGILLIFLASCAPSNHFVQPSTRKECVNLFSAKIIFDIPSPVRMEKENYEEGVTYTYVFKDGGCILIHEGALMQFDIDTYKPSRAKHKPEYSVYWGVENDKLWKKYVYGNVRFYYFNVNKAQKKIYEKAFRTMKILKTE